MDLVHSLVSLKPSSQVRQTDGSKFLLGSQALGHLAASFPGGRLFTHKVTFDGTMRALQI